MSSPKIEIRPLGDDERAWAAGLLGARRGSTRVVSRGRVHAPDRLPGFVAWLEGRPAGLLCFDLRDGALEVVTLDSLIQGRGVATQLLEAAREHARAEGCGRVWGVATNDATSVLRFLRRRGFTIAAVHPGAADEARRLEPAIPLLGAGGVPIRDEIELEIAP